MMRLLCKRGLSCLLVICLGLPLPASAAPVSKWRTPVSSYPKEALAKRIAGSGLVRITTDENGRIATAQMQKSTGSKILDEATLRVARADWQGPPGRTTVVPVDYLLPPERKRSSARTGYPGWTMPKHDYPFDAGDRYAQGRGIIKVTTNEQGRVKEAVMVQSTGQVTLDEDAVENARRNWRGPASTSIQVPVAYRIDMDGPPPVPSVPGNRWTTRAPHYPYTARANVGSGSGMIKVATDRNGRVVKAVMILSTGEKILDENTVNFALAHWSGPPNSETKVPITYRLQRDPLDTLPTL